MRRGKPELLVAALIGVLLAWYVVYTQRVIVLLRADAKRSIEMYARVYRAFGDNTPSAETEALLDLSRSIRDQHVPLILSDPQGGTAGHANLPFDNAKDTVSNDDPRVRAYIAVLAAKNPPIVDPRIGKVYYGDPPVVEGLTIIPALQAVMAAILVLAGLYIIRTRGNAARERLWAGMARESAHQLGPPLSSLSGWVELLEESADDDRSHAAARHMRADLERLDRVAHRFERIGREPKYDEINVTDVVERMARYFQVRVPTLANTVTVESAIEENLPVVHGDPVLLEWAVEVLAKNAIDALAGRGGRISLSARRGPD